MQKPPLHLRILFHPGSQIAGDVAKDLVSRFVEPPASVGLRIPTFFGPDNGDSMPPPQVGPQSLDLDIAQHTLVVLLTDTRTTRQVDSKDTGDNWKEFAEWMYSRVDQSNGKHHFFVAALDEGGFDLPGERNVVSASGSSIAERADCISLQIAIRAIMLLRDESLNEDDSRGIKAPVTLFMSHAKADLPTEEELSEGLRPDPVNRVLAECVKLPVEDWFDSAKILPGEKFTDRITNDLKHCAVAIVFLTDHFATRPWCRREVLEAKRVSVPILVVDALQQGEPRSFPYLGNAPTLRWELSGGPIDEVETRLARSVVERAIRESLRTLHNLKTVEGKAGPDEHVLSTTPELVTLAYQNAARDGSDETGFVYPDPPLSGEELEVLAFQFPTLQFKTPLSKLTEQPLPESVRHIAVSISDVSKEDLKKHGLTQMHFEMMSDELHLYLLLAGAQIGYGGALKGDMTKASNFTLRLFEIVRGYSSLARDVGTTGLLPIVNYPPWPLSETYTDDDLNLMSGVSQLERGPVPEGQVFSETFPPRNDGKWPLIPDSPSKRYAWSRGLTEMRRVMNDRTAARVITGGKLAGFAGAVAGILEEAWFPISTGKPLFLVGAFGGIGGAVVDLLEGRDVEQFSDEFATGNVPDYAAVKQLYADNKIQFVSAAQMAGEIQAAARQKGIAGALNNGLTDEQNQELFRIVDPATSAELILEGLRNLSGN